MIAWKFFPESLPQSFLPLTAKKGSATIPRRKIKCLKSRFIVSTAYHVKSQAGRDFKNFTGKVTKALRVYLLYCLYFKEVVYGRKENHFVWEAGP